MKWNGLLNNKQFVSMSNVHALRRVGVVCPFWQWTWNRTGQEWECRKLARTNRNQKKIDSCNYGVCVREQRVLRRWLYKWQTHVDHSARYTDEITWPTAHVIACIRNIGHNANEMKLKWNEKTFFLSSLRWMRDGTRLCMYAPVTTATVRAIFRNFVYVVGLVLWLCAQIPFTCLFSEIYWV